MTYQLGNHCILRNEDHASIPLDPDNRDYAAYLAWVEAGNTPEPAIAPTPDQIKAHAWDAIKAERDRRRTGGVAVGAKWFHSDDASRIQQLGLVMMGSAIPAGLQWKTMDGTFVAMTQTLAGQIFNAAAASDQAIFARAEQHKAAMEAAADPARYDYSAGWPAIYGE